MPRTKTGVTRHHRHRKVLSMTKGFRGTNTRLYKRAHEALLHAGQYAFIGRKRRKRDFRRLWIARINAGVHQASETLNYSRFIKGLKDKNIQLDRKSLAELAVNDFTAFTQLVKVVES